MKGSTRKRGKTWTAYWDTAGPIETGARKQKTHRRFRTQKDAQRHLATVIVQVGEGTYIEPSKQPLGAVHGRRVATRHPRHRATAHPPPLRADRRAVHRAAGDRRRAAAQPERRRS